MGDRQLLWVDFDTMLAAQLLGLARIGLASLLDQHFGVALDKEEKDRADRTFSGIDFGRRGRGGRA